MKNVEYYGQTGEDLILKRLLPEKSGTYLDIGAGNPIRSSNTYPFYKTGWSGIAIDPLELNQRLFKVFRRRDNFVMAVISESSKVYKFWELEPYAYSTLDSERVSYLLASKHAIIMKIHNGTSITLGDLPISMKPNDPTLLCIDAEGSDLDVLLGNNWNNIRPRVICIESLSTEANTKDLAEILLSSHGYKIVARTSLSHIYVSTFTAP